MSYNLPPVIPQQKSSSSKVYDNVFDNSTILKNYKADITYPIINNKQAHYMRPRSASGLNRPITSIPPHPPSNDNNETIESTVGQDIIYDILNNDELLRIRTAEYSLFSNQAISSAEKGDLKGILVAFELGLDIVNIKGFQGFSLLHHACNRGHVEIVYELLRMCLPIDARNDSQETPLHLAVYSGNILIVDMLLDKGANINAANYEGETPLFYASRKGMPAMVRLLLQRGSNYNHKDKYGELAIDHAYDKNTSKAFDGVNIGGLVFSGSKPLLMYEDLLRVFSYLELKDVLRSSCVSTKWHRVSEHEQIWQRLGVRRWELALRSSLGFAPSAASSFYRPKISPKNNNISLSSKSSHSQLLNDES
eukprot:gene12045-16119_t